MKHKIAPENEGHLITITFAPGELWFIRESLEMKLFGPSLPNSSGSRFLDYLKKIDEEMQVLERAMRDRTEKKGENYE